MKRYLTAVGILAVVAVLLLVLPLGAGASSDKRFVLAIRGTLTGETTGAGTFSVAGALSDSGIFGTQFAATPGRNNCYSVTSDWVFTATGGGFTLHGSGSSCSSSANDPRAIEDFKFRITNGTGAYAGLSGIGTATGEADFTDGTFTTVFDAKVGRIY